MKIGGREFGKVWAVDFEFSVRPGERPEPVCMVARELTEGRTVRLWQDELRGRTVPPYSTGKDDLFIAYYASAEIGCHLALGWPVPVNVLDLHAEFRTLTNGKQVPCGNGLLGALAYFGLDGIETAAKESMRELALRGGPWTEAERRMLLSYCESDVDALARLLPKMLPHLDLPRALLRGRYMAAAARMENVGVPIDTEALGIARRLWQPIQDRLIERVDAGFGIYEGRTFKRGRFEQWLTRNGIPWPRLPSGALALDDRTFREMAKAHPGVSLLHELRVTLSKMRLHDLEVGRDGRNRSLLSAFRAKTGRNQPSNSRFIFGPAVWVRGFIRPEPGWGLAYIDWEQQEFGIAAALSGDPAMLDAYRSGDPYLTFAKQTGAAPADATKESHAFIREQYKQVVLAVQYGMGADALAQRLGQSAAAARELLRQHRETYPVFWHWSEAAVSLAMLRGKLHTVFGWSLHTGPATNARSLANFPMQANGAEMLRLACCLATERGVRVCAPVHDALLIEAPLEALLDAIGTARAAMAEASRIVLGGFELRTEAKEVRYPNRYQDKRGEKMWTTVWEIVQELEPDNLRAGALLTCAPTQKNPRTGAQPPHSHVF